MMSSPVWESTLEQFRSAAGSSEPIPAGVAVSATSASFALGLLAKVLKVTGRKKGFSGDLSRIEKLADSARAESKHMMQLAEDDMAAFNDYMISARLPQATDREREERKRAVNASVHKAIETPLAAARAAVAGISLCADSMDMVHAVVAADLGAAASLLAGALRVFLLCADSNIRQVAPDPSVYRDVLPGRAEWESRAFRQADSVLRQVSAIIEGVANAKKP
ncbi:MAG TPA: cyclodeaminase/cyclohydrolase family protein [Candidatus Acidoferrales bacterium]|nr:cyclodeaminase/cyclohydrolase family protein [Candidatus Acidoferrales bacterium]